MQIYDAADLSAGDFKQILTFFARGRRHRDSHRHAYGLAADPFNETAVRKDFSNQGPPGIQAHPGIVDSMRCYGKLPSIPKTLRCWPEILAGTADDDSSGTGHCTTPRHGRDGHDWSAMAAGRVSDKADTRVRRAHYGDERE